MASDTFTPNDSDAALVGRDVILDEPVEAERYELQAAPVWRFDANRRQFVQVLGAGLVLAVAAPTVRGQQRGRGGRGGRRGGGRSARLSERFHLGADGIVTVLTSKVEVGQGSRTQLTQAAAEELHLPPERIRLVMADTLGCPDDGGTAGSRTTPSSVPQVRTAAAALHELLHALAAEKLAVEREKLVWSEGRFTVRDSDKKLELAELAALESLPERLGAAVRGEMTLTPVKQWNVLGTTLPKVDGRSVVTGTAKYPSDVTLPEMLYGKVLRRPSFGAKLRSIDLEPARKMAGVTIVHDGEFVGCVAKNSYLAGRALASIAATAQWDRPPHVSSDKLFEHLKATAREGGGGRFGGGRGNTWGNLQEALAAAAKTIEAGYTIAYVHHAPMEPRAAVAQWSDGKLTVWTGTQQPSRVQGELAGAFRLSGDKVRVIVPDTGGGFGGKHTGEAAVEAARLAKAAARPVSLRWTREEEFAWAYSRPAGLIEVQAAFDKNGRVSVWDFANYNSGGSAIDTPYQIASGRTRTLSADSPLRQGSYRALASTANVFARESMMDELAHATGADPLEFRLRQLPAGRLRDVLQQAAGKFDWGNRRKAQPKGHGVGLACGTEKGSFVAACAEVAVQDGKYRVLSVTQAYECGAICNPGNLRAQVEGCIVMGLGGALYEELLFKDGMLTNGRFSQYTVPRMHHLPQLDVVLHNRPDLPSLGAGETPIIAVAPAIANALFHASGRRLRSMPLRSAELLPV